MTREEAIRIIETVFQDEYVYKYYDSITHQALDMAIEALKQVTGKLKKPDDSLLTADPEACKEQKSKLDLISRQDAIDAIEIVDWYHQNSNKDMVSGANSDEHQVWYKADDVYKALEAVPSADRPRGEEDQLKFYYVESIDDYWIGMRIDNFYYADWHEGLGFVWSKSRYLPWGEHIVDEKTLWKEHTYPSEPIEIPFTEWIVGFVKKYFADRPRPIDPTIEVDLESGVVPRSAIERKE